MIRKLYIHNIILIEKAEISFAAGLNVLSGETGSGKSAIMEALALIIGEKADTSLIRRGADKGTVEAVIELARPSDALISLLEESGIEHDPAGDLIIRREIHINGKSRAFINQQNVQVSLLKKLSECLLDIVGQHANQRLLSTEFHRQMIDLYGSLTELAKRFSQSYGEEQRLREELHLLISNEAQRQKEKNFYLLQVEELREANFKEGEEDEIFNEFTLLANAENLAQKIQWVNDLLQHEEFGILQNLNKCCSAWDAILSMDPKLEQVSQLSQNARVELQEVAFALDHYLSKIEINPQKMEKLNERLSVINRLKKKYGPSLAHVQDSLCQADQKLKDLDAAEIRLEELKDALEILEQKNRGLAEELSLARKVAAKNFEKEMTEQLRSLNMPKIVFEVVIEPQRISKNGFDKIEFFLTPNVGEYRIPVKDCASGGELSRLMLALQALLAGKGGIPILVFDEIDSNIGGTTATIVGEKLGEIGSCHQVLCITHYPQVAKHANYHLQISKQEIEGRTFTSIKTLDKESQAFELSRMQGM